ncbi:hypothetical protein ACW582_03515 [Pseudomonas chlororaphis]
MTYSMLSLDLADADVGQRNGFYELLHNAGWVKLAGVDTVWQKRFDDTFLNPSIQRRIISLLEESAGETKVKLLTFAVQIGDRVANTGRLFKIPGGYETSFN